MPQDIGNGVTHWGANETKEFYKYWDSPARKENAAAKAAEDDKRSPLEKKKHSRRQRQAIRNFNARKQSSKVTEEGNHKIMPHGSAYEQQKAGLANPNSKQNMKRAKRKEKQRMAGERMEMLNQQNNSNTFKYEKNKYDKRKDYRMF